MTAASLPPHRCLDKHSFVAGSDAQVTINADEPVLLQFRRERHRDAEPEALSAKPRPSQPCDCASAEPTASPVRAAHAEFVAAVARGPRGVSLSRLTPSTSRIAPILEHGAPRAVGLFDRDP